MPNIELIGFPIAEVNDDLLTPIREIISDMGLIADAVITHYEGSRVIDYNGHSQPFARVCSTSLAQATLIADRLQKRLPELDVELVEIAGFKPGEKPPVL